MIYDIGEFKAAKMFLEDLNKIIPVLEKAEEELASYTKYQAVLTVLNAPGAIRDALATAKAFRDLYANVIKNKGVKIEKIFTD